jgi:hypothetical protein
MKITSQNLLLCITLAVTPLFAQTAPLSDQDVRVAGTRWTASVTTERGEFVSCQINLNIEDGVQLRYTIGSKGSLVLLLNDKYLEAQVSDVLGWTEGQSYRAALFLDDKKFNGIPGSGAPERIHRGFGLISDALPFGRLWLAGRTRPATQWTMQTSSVTDYFFS